MQTYYSLFLNETTKFPLKRLHVNQSGHVESPTRTSSRVGREGGGCS